MNYELDNMIDLDKLDLYYEAHMLGIDWECFIYPVYFKDKLNETKFGEINKVLDEFVEKNNDYERYIGYIDVLKKEDRVDIFLDLVNVESKYQMLSIQGILKAINNVSGIKQVMINESLWLIIYV